MRMADGRHRDCHCNSATAVVAVPNCGQLMKKSSLRAEPSEPIGIVIAGPGWVDATPRVAAYVWGPAPDQPSDEHVEPRAA